MKEIMTIEEAKEMLEEVQRRRANGENPPCPRCGKQITKPPCTNALSRQIDVMICEQCGVEETIMAFYKQEPLDLLFWSVNFKERRRRLENEPL